MNHIFIIDSKLTNGKSQEIASEIEKICAVIGICPIVRIAENEMEVAFFANLYKNDSCIIYAIGGDATLNIVLNIIIGCKAYLGVLPYGIGNSFYHSLSKEMPEFDCNVMKVNNLYCLNIFSIGIASEISKYATKLEKMQIGERQSYFLSTMYTFFKYKNEPMMLNVDGKIFYDLMSSIAICNGSFIIPQLSLISDANLSGSNPLIIMAGDVKKIEVLAFLETLRTNNYDNDRHTEVVNGKNIAIVADREIEGNVDGRIITSDTFNIDTSASKIKVVKNEKIIELIRKRNKK